MIEINNLTGDSVDQDHIRKIVSFVLKEENSDQNLSIAFVGEGRMRKLNKMYRGKNKVTDILSFPESKILFKKFKVGPRQESEGLGEMVVCLREIKKNAKRFKSAFLKELTLILIHGTLHLLGYDHEKETDNQMEEKQNYYLNKILK